MTTTTTTTTTRISFFVCVSLIRMNEWRRRTRSMSLRTIAWLSLWRKSMLWSESSCWEWRCRSKLLSIEKKQRRRRSRKKNEEENEIDETKIVWCHWRDATLIHFRERVDLSRKIERWWWWYENIMSRIELVSRVLQKNRIFFFKSVHNLMTIFERLSFSFLFCLVKISKTSS